MGRLLVVLVLISVHVVRGASQETAYDGDQTVGACVNTLIRLSINSENLDCLLFRPYLKCISKVTKLYKFPAGHTLYTTLNNQANALARRAGFNCQFDIEAVSAEVAVEQNVRAIPIAAIEMEATAEKSGRQQKLSQLRSRIQN